MLYPIVIHHDEGSAYGVTVPDIPGCFSAGDTLDEALKNTREAIELSLEVLMEEGQEPPRASNLEDLMANEDYAGGIWMLIDVDITPFLGKSQKINITMPGGLLKRIDDLVAKDPQYGSRSGFFAALARERIGV